MGVAICSTGKTVESGYLAHAPDESTTATCALDNGTRSLALIDTTDPPSFMMSFDFHLKLTVVKVDHCIHACSYVPVRNSTNEYALTC